MLTDVRRFVPYFDQEERSEKAYNQYHAMSRLWSRSYREVPPLRADLEEPKTPLLINASDLKLGIVIGAKTLYEDRSK